MGLEVLFFVVWGVCIFVGTYLGINRGIPLWGFFNSLFFGPIGVFVVVIQEEKDARSCPKCAEKIKKAASICPHCRSNV